MSDNFRGDVVRLLAERYDTKSNEKLGLISIPASGVLRV